MNSQNLTSNNLSLLVWNVQAAGSRNFLLTLKESIYKHDPQILALVEIKISGQLADNVCSSIGVRGLHRLKLRDLVDLSGYYDGQKISSYRR